METLTIAVGGGALVLGILLGYLGFNSVLTKKKNDILKEAEAKGENIKEKKILQAKEKFLAMKEKHDASVKKRNSEIQSKESKLKNREGQLSKQLEQNKRKEKELDNQKTASIRS